MNILPVFIILATLETFVICQDIRNIFENINKRVEKYNGIAADLAWESSINPDNTQLPIKSAKYQKERIKWQQNACDGLATLKRRHSFNDSQERQSYLLCRGPKYTFEEARLMSSVYEELQSIYTEAEVCIPTEDNKAPTNLTEMESAILKFLTAVKQFTKTDSDSLAAKVAAKDGSKDNKGFCLSGEDDFQMLMAFSRNEKVLSWLWTAWREKVGPPMRIPYRKLIDMENTAARRNGYPDIGASWRAELEIPNLRQKCRHLYQNILPLYKLLHGVVRFFLRMEYGDIVPEHGPIPAHLLGNLWSQNWEPLADLIIPKTIDLDATIKKLNWTTEHMIKRAEDFYQSLGLPPLTDTFWKKSVFTKDSKRMRCHGAAADMFKPQDFRLLYCCKTTIEDVYVLHHELGHIQYYMAYEHQPALFRQANAAFHEALGDTIMYGVMTPQHLHRLGLINDSLLYGTNEIIIGTDDTVTKTKSLNDNTKLVFGTKNIIDKKGKLRQEELKEVNSDSNVNKNTENIIQVTTDDILLLKQALNKIPQIPFSLLIDEFRWKYFEGKLNSFNLNNAFWQMALELQGIAPPFERGIEEFDAGAKFHVPDNTPYIRYFLSSFLQHQLFESICKASVFGRRGVKDPLPDTITMNRCDVYGSKAAGKLLKDIMSRGHSQHWRQILLETTGHYDIYSDALERYYQPVNKVLTKLVRIHRIPIGW